MSSLRLAICELRSPAAARSAPGARAPHDTLAREERTIPAETWRAFYQSDLQGLWLLCVAPVLFLLSLPFLRRPASRAAYPPAAGFVTAWAVVFALETLLDPWATGPLVRALGWQDGWGHTAVMFLFVLLGDFRIFLLLFHLAARERALAGSLREAAAWTLLVPAAAGALRGALGLVAGELPGQVLWLIYETLFAALALWLRARLLPARVGPGWPPLVRFLRAVCAFVAFYYGLWATADVLILSGVDAGWALRVIPNQLYYGLTVPFVWLRFFHSPQSGIASRRGA